MSKDYKNKLPKHVAIIMDGNRRWAKKRGLPSVAGHKFVVEDLVERLIEHAASRGVKYLTLWAFSTENWKRSEKEVVGILKLFRWALEKRASRLIEKGARVKMIGDIEKFPEDIRGGFERMIDQSKNNN
ncbi:polyprenyl diphosphate synthase, partial [Patescibacteria group bacterium]